MTETTIGRVAIACTIIDLPPDIAAALDAGPDARALLTVREGRLSIEILSTPRSQIDAAVDRFVNNFSGYLEAMKRIGRVSFGERVNNK